MSLSARLTRLEKRQSDGRSRIIVVSGGAGWSSDELQAFIAASSVRPTDRDWIEYDTSTGPLSIDVLSVALPHEQALELIG